jgi:hypothetical protein
MTMKVVHNDAGTASVALRSRTRAPAFEKLDIVDMLNRASMAVKEPASPTPSSSSSEKGSHSRDTIVSSNAHPRIIVNNGETDHDRELWPEDSASNVYFNPTRALGACKGSPTPSTVDGFDVFSTTHSSASGSFPDPARAHSLRTRHKVRRAHDDTNNLLVATQDGLGIGRKQRKREFTSFAAMEGMHTVNGRVVRNEVLSSGNSSMPRKSASAGDAMSFDPDDPSVVCRTFFKDPSTSTISTRRTAHDTKPSTPTSVVSSSAETFTTARTAPSSIIESTASGVASLSAFPTALPFEPIPTIPELIRFLDAAETAYGTQRKLKLREKFLQELRVARVEGEEAQRKAVGRALRSVADVIDRV